MNRLGLALVVLQCLAGLGAAQEAADFRPVKIKVDDRNRIIGEAD